MVLHAIPTKEKAKREIHVLFLQRNYYECEIQGSQQDSCPWTGKESAPSSRLLLPTGVLGLLHQERLIRGQTRNSGQALSGTLLLQGAARMSNRFPGCLPGVGRE